MIFLMTIKYYILVMFDKPHSTLVPDCCDNDIDGQGSTVSQVLDIYIYYVKLQVQSCNFF